MLALLHQLTDLPILLLATQLLPVLLTLLTAQFASQPTVHRLATDLLTTHTARQFLSDHTAQPTVSLADIMLQLTDLPPSNKPHQTQTL
jgi:hypothetical protein